MSTLNGSVRVINGGKNAGVIHTQETDQRWYFFTGYSGDTLGIHDRVDFTPGSASSKIYVKVGDTEMSIGNAVQATITKITEKSPG